MSKTNIEFIFDGKITDLNEFGISHVHRRSEIPQWFIDECRAEAAECAKYPFAPWARQFRLWGSVADHMIAVGHDYSREPIESTKRLLRAWGLDDLIIDKRVV